MIIKLSPYAPLSNSMDALVVTKSGDTLTINGVAYDFSVIPDGATLPASAVDCDYVTGDIERISGDLHITLRLPLGANPSDAACFPVDIVNPIDGVLEFPR